MSERSALLGPFHIISYGSLLGIQVHQTFIGGTIAFRALPRPQFSVLQNAVFPVYFSLQSVLPAVIAATYPGVRDFVGYGPSSVPGVLEEGHRVTTLLPLATTLIGGLTNLLIVGPAVTKIMKERKHQETIDGKKSYDPGPHSSEMIRLNKSFGRLHGISSLVNLIGLVATAYYGKTLADRLL